MRLEQDIIKINGKKIFINPFLYSRKFNEKTRRWLKEPGQISQSRINLNRSKFYPDINWENLSLNEKLLKDTTIELFLKTIQIINTFNPNLNSKEVLEVEKQLITAKKLSFEKWSRKFFIKKDRFLVKEKRKLELDNFINKWQKWFFLKETQKLLAPLFVIILVSFLLGWFLGISKNSCNPYFESSSSIQL
tara:strand:- start:436 stop:1008 length:573 start_codon:yes stop_codon:yes gene_type:complete